MGRNVWCRWTKTNEAEGEKWPSGACIPRPKCLSKRSADSELYTLAARDAHIQNHGAMQRKSKTVNKSQGLTFGFFLINPADNCATAESASIEPAFLFFEKAPWPICPVPLISAPQLLPAAASSSAL